MWLCASLSVQPSPFAPREKVVILVRLYLRAGWPVICIAPRQDSLVVRYDVSDGLHIRWRETAPDRGLLTFALAEIDALHSQWPETLQCNIVIERAPLSLACDADDGEQPRFLAQVELDLGRRSPRVKAKVLHSDLYAALRAAFGDLRDAMPTYVGNDVTAEAAA